MDRCCELTGLIDRYAPTFGALCYDPSKERDAVPFAETGAAQWGSFTEKNHQFKKPTDRAHTTPESTHRVPYQIDQSP